MAEETVLRWSAYEHEHFERSSDWYWALGIVAVSIAITSVLLSDLLFGILILVAAATIALLSREAPDIATIELSERGVRINGTLHRYREILAFWVEDEHPDRRPLLLVDTTKWLSPNLIIPIEHVDPRLVRAFLMEHTEERHMKEPIGHKILEFFGL
jgi:hypothetical protein